MKKCKILLIIMVIVCCFSAGFITSAYSYNIWLSEGFMTIPAPIRLCYSFCIDTKCAIGAAAETWTNGYGSEFVYIDVNENSNTLNLDADGYNDNLKGYRGPTNGVANLMYIQYNSTLTGAQEMDIEFNIDYPLGDASVNTNVYDVQSIALHEFGHLLGLDDIYSDSSAVMFSDLNAGQMRRSLSENDSAGLNAIY